MEDIRKKIVEIFDQLRDELAKDLNSIDPSSETDAQNLLIAKVREKNRKWNECRLQHPELGLAEDGFQKLIKKSMLEAPIEKDMADILRKYL